MLTLVVHQSEVQDYSHIPFRRVVTHTVYKSAGTRNHVLNSVAKGKWLLSLDDDIDSVGMFRPRSDGKLDTVRMSGVDWLRTLFSFIHLAASSGAYLVGVAPTTNPLFALKHRVARDVFINGPCYAVRVSDIRFDESLPVKCDYDFTLHHMSKGLKVMRADYLWQRNDYGKKPGGRMMYSTPDDSGDAIHMLSKKWPGMFRLNTRRPGEIILLKRTATKL